MLACSAIFWNCTSKGYQIDYIYFGLMASKDFSFEDFFLCWLVPLIKQGTPSISLNQSIDIFSDSTIIIDLSGILWWKSKIAVWNVSGVCFESVLRVSRYLYNTLSCTVIPNCIINWAMKDNVFSNYLVIRYRYSDYSGTISC